MYDRDDSVLSDILLLVGVDVPTDVMSGWTDSQCQQAEDWAVAWHLIANDHNDVAPLPKPEFLKPFQKEY